MATLVMCETSTILLHCSPVLVSSSYACHVHHFSVTRSRERRLLTDMYFSRCVSKRDTCQTYFDRYDLDESGTQLLQRRPHVFADVLSYDRDYE